MGKISGPLMDRFDLRLEVPAVEVTDLARAPTGETSAQVAQRVNAARIIQAKRYSSRDDITVNADVSGDHLMEIAEPDTDGRAILLQAVDRFRLSARGYHRVLKVARTIADLDASEGVRRPHVAEALAYRLVGAT